LLKSIVRRIFGTRTDGGALVGHLQECDENVVSGWIAHPERPSATYPVVLNVDGHEAARVLANQPAPPGAPLPPVGGSHGFSFSPRPYLPAGRHCVLDAIMVDDAGRATVLGRGHAGLLDLAEIDALAPDAAAAYLSRSQERWREGESGASLTWGRLMTGDSFLDEVQQARPLRETDVLVEIGPGYGRLLKTILERALPFRKYVGLDISPAKVATLQQQFSTDPRIGFQACDVISGEVPQDATVVICSGTLEHLFPSVRGLLANLRRQIRGPFTAILDFKADEKFMRSMAWFETAGGAFVRTYTRAELENVFRDAGYQVRGIPEIVLGRSLDDIEVKRFLVIAEAP